MQLVGFIIRIYHDTRSSECQILLVLYTSMIMRHVTIDNVPPEWWTARLWYTLKSVALEPEELWILVFAFRNTRSLDYVCHLVFQKSQKKTRYLWKGIYFRPQVKRLGWTTYPVCPIRRPIFFQTILFAELILITFPYFRNYLVKPFGKSNKYEA